MKDYQLAKKFYKEGKHSLVEKIACSTCGCSMKKDELTKIDTWEGEEPITDKVDIEFPVPETTKEKPIENKTIEQMNEEFFDKLSKELGIEPNADYKQAKKLYQDKQFEKVAQIAGTNLGFHRTPTYQYLYENAITALAQQKKVLPTEQQVEQYYQNSVKGFQDKEIKKYIETFRKQGYGEKQLEKIQQDAMKKAQAAEKEFSQNQQIKKYTWLRGLNSAKKMLGVVQPQSSQGQSQGVSTQQPQSSSGQQSGQSQPVAKQPTAPAQKAQAIRYLEMFKKFAPQFSADTGIELGSIMPTIDEENEVRRTNNLSPITNKINIVKQQQRQLAEQLKNVKATLQLMYKVAQVKNVKPAKPMKFEQMKNPIDGLWGPLSSSALQRVKSVQQPQQIQPVQPQISLDPMEQYQTNPSLEQYKQDEQKLDEQFDPEQWKQQQKGKIKPEINPFEPLPKGTQRSKEEQDWLSQNQSDLDSLENL